jgi:predicted short-subunit dehydrogenase-like oxidoreductase (DUF2520 family)
MAAKPRIAIVGPGKLGTALVLSLAEAGYKVDEIVARSGAKPAVRQIAAKVGARLSNMRHPTLRAELVWLCVPDGIIAPCAKSLANSTGWKGKIVFHASGAFSSRELETLRKKGAAVASVHPLMTFVRKVRPSLDGVSFAMEGDPAALRMAQRIVLDLGGEPFLIDARHKPAYHAWGAFTSPLLVAFLLAGEQVALLAGLKRQEARKRMQPIIRQTLANYFEHGPAQAFSGPIIRGDVATIQKHLRSLKRVREAKQVYIALARAALRELPAKNRKLLEEVLGK